MRASLLLRIICHPYPAPCLVSGRMSSWLLDDEDCCHRSRSYKVRGCGSSLSVLYFEIQQRCIVCCRCTVQPFFAIVHEAIDVSKVAWVASFSACFLRGRLGLQDVDGNDALHGALRPVCARERSVKKKQGCITKNSRGEL